MPPAHRPQMRSLFHILIILAGCVCVSAPSLIPLTRGELPLSADGLVHLHRGIALEHALRVDHALWPRFASGLAYGYGAPLFHYFPPLAYMPMTWFAKIGTGFVGGFLLSLSLFTLVAALGSFALARHWTGAHLAGWVATIAYVNSPYALFNSLTRGALAEVAALAILPWVLFAFARLADSGRRSDMALAILTFSLFIPLHTLITLHGTALLLIVCLFSLWRAAERRRALLRLLLAGGLALALTAFYWLPALLESDQIKLHLIRDQLSHIDAARNLRPLADIVALPHQADATQQNQAVPISLGLPQLALAALGLALSIRPANRAFRPLLALLGMLTLVLVFMNTPASQSLWRAIPLIGYTQFPWRLLGLASLTLACMAALGALLLWRGLPSGLPRWILLAAIVGVILLYAMPWSFTAYHTELAVDDIRDTQRFEGLSGQVALGSYAEYLPVTADLRLLDPRRLMDRFATSDVIARLDESDSIGIESATWRGTSVDLRLETTAAQTLVFDWLYAPGWRATLNGTTAPVTPSTAGLVSLDLPRAGVHDLHLSLGATPIQTVAEIISAIGVAGFALMFLLWNRVFPNSGRTRPPLRVERHVALFIVALCLGALLLRLALESRDSPFKAARFGDVKSASALANFDNRIDLLRVDFPAIAQSDINFTLYWRLRDAPLERDYASIIRMRDPAGHVIAEGSAFAPGGLPTRNWRPGMYIKDRIRLRIPPFTPPLDAPYTFELSLFDVGNLNQLSLINAAGDPQAVNYALGSRLYRPSNADREAEWARSPALRRSGDLTVELIEAPILPSTGAVGDEMRFSWTWRMVEASETDFGARLLWLDEAGGVAAEVAFPQIVNGYSTDRWRSGEVNRGHHSIILPPSLPKGEYALALQRLDADGAVVGATIELEGKMTVSAPRRNFAAPDFVADDVARWDNGIALAGTQLNAAEIELAWRTENPLDESLRLFVHALDADGRIAAQSDGVPVDWTRPTTGWLPGEFVLTRHQFDLPPGAYRLRIGWYRPQSGERIGMDGADALTLADALVVE